MKKIPHYNQYSGKSQEERFWEKVDKSNIDGCWIWIGAKLLNGYGIMRWNNTNIYVHRISYRLFTGEELFKDDIIRHTCNTPLCCNQHHLLKGTHKDNVLDKVLANRQTKGEQVPSHVLSSNQVLTIRSLLKDGFSYREIARQYSISHTTVEKIANKKTWRHI